MSIIRIYIDHPLNTGEVAPLTAKQAHYLKHVMRQELADTIQVFNGKDGEWRASIVELGKKSGSVNIKDQVREQVTEPDVWLVFAPIKHGNIDFLAQKVAELGASALLPMRTQHTVVNRVNQERLAANVTEAAEQSERLTVPTVHELQSLENILKNWDEERQILLCDEAGGSKPIAEALETEQSGMPWAIFVGPEGGFSPQELEMLRAKNYVTSVGLGPRVLRAETAATAALACWQAQCGDWEHAPRFEN